MEIFKKDLSISGAMEKILSISINLSRWIVKAQFENLGELVKIPIFVG